jgi:hypothetical protein
MKDQQPRRPDGVARGSIRSRAKSRCSVSFIAFSFAAGVTTPELEDES